MDNYFVVGKIINTHGIKGAVKIYPTTDDNKRFELLKQIYVDNRGNIEILNIEKIQYFKNLLIIKFEEINSIDEAQKYRQCSLLVEKDDALPLEENEYYIKDLYDMEVISDEGEYLGILTDIIFTGSNDVYVITTDGKELLLPAIKDCIKKVDVTNRKMTVHLMEGLRNS